MQPVLACMFIVVGVLEASNERSTINYTHHKTYLMKNSVMIQSLLDNAMAIWPQSNIVIANRFVVIAHVDFDLTTSNEKLSNV
jgi:hypothetical protein